MWQWEYLPWTNETMSIQGRFIRGWAEKKPNYVVWSFYVFPGVSVFKVVVGTSQCPLKQGWLIFETPLLFEFGFSGFWNRKKKPEMSNSTSSNTQTSTIRGHFLYFNLSHQSSYFVIFSVSESLMGRSQAPKPCGSQHFSTFFNTNASADQKTTTLPSSSNLWV